MTTPPTTSQLLDRAIKLHREGRIAEAITLYRDAVRQAPSNAAALNLLGLSYFQSGEPDRAVPLLQKAIALKPDLPSAHFNLGQILQSLGRNGEALPHYEMHLAQQPSDAQAHNDLGVVLRALGRDQDAVVRFRAAAGLDPRLVAAHYNLGNALFAVGGHDDARAAYERAVALAPENPDAHVGLTASLNALGRHGDALERSRHALVTWPDNVELALNLGYALHALRRFDEAVGVYQRLIALSPKHAAAHHGLGVVLEELDRHDDALESYQRAIERSSNEPKYLWNKGNLALALGRFEQGWAPFEQRWAAHGNLPRAYPQPRWSGDFLDGTLLVWPEQGLGDQIVYSSMLGALRDRATSLCVEVEPRLVPLFARSFPQIQVVPSGVELHGGPVAAQIPMASLGGHLLPRWDCFKQPAQPYLTADAARTADLRARLRGDGRCLIGLSWRSANPKFEAVKTASLHDFAAVFRIPGCRFIDLQYGDTARERAAVAEALGTEVVHVDDVDNLNDIDALAALISACDLVLTVSNTTAHLAGALGRPTWVLLPSGGARAWFWFRDRDKSPWYPDVNIRRQQRNQSWASLIDRVAPEIAAAVAAAGRRD